MLPGVINHLVNPDFSLTDFGTSARTSTGYVVPRWKLELAGAPVASAAPATLPSDIGQAKWLRGKSGVSINVTTLGAADRVMLRQRIEGADRFSRQAAHVTMVAYGPSGGLLRFGIEDAHRIMTTRGTTSAQTASFVEAISDPSVEYMTVTVEVLAPGEYTIAFVQVDWPDNLDRLPSLEIRPRALERMLASRYVYPLRRGSFVATASTQQMLPVEFPVTMRTSPTIASTAPSIEVAELRTGNSTTITGVTATVLDASTGGCRVRLTGTHSVSLAATDGFLLTDLAVVLSADY